MKQRNFAAAYAELPGTEKRVRPDEIFHNILAHIDQESVE
jgi:hypothetical protein